MTGIPLGDRMRGCLVGLAVGDAVGTTLEFSPRGSFQPIQDMIGGGPYHLKPGQWTDDTSMALCLAESLVEQGAFDPADQMERYVRWWKEGYLSSTGECFDIGQTVRTALQSYLASRKPFSGPTDPHTAGNGSLMRLAPVLLYYSPNREEMIEYSAESSRTTHGTRECLDACRLFAALIYKAFTGEPRGVVLDPCPFPSMNISLSPKIEAIARGSWEQKTESEIQADGYVVNSLEAAIWSFDRTGNFAEAVLCAANLGEDADTTAAICGQLAGAYYGLEGIPKKWRKQLHLYSFILELADQLIEKGR